MSEFSKLVEGIENLSLKAKNLEEKWNSLQKKEEELKKREEALCMPCEAQTPKKEVCCFMCGNPLWSPVGFNKVYKEEGGVTYFYTCKAMQRELACLPCMRRFIQTQMDDHSPKIRCPFNCCEAIIPQGRKIYKLYGDVTRQPHDPADIATWNLLDSYGVLNLKCNRCGMNTENIDNFIKHDKSVCPKRLIPCQRCKQLVAFEDIPNHQAEKGANHTFRIL